MACFAPLALLSSTHAVTFRCLTALYTLDARLFVPALSAVCTLSQFLMNSGYVCAWCLDFCSIYRIPYEHITALHSHLVWSGPLKPNSLTPPLSPSLTTPLSNTELALLPSPQKSRFNLFQHFSSQHVPFLSQFPFTIVIAKFSINDRSHFLST